MKPSNYYFNKWIFRGATLAALIFWITIMLTYGFNDRIYVHCPENTGLCHNPLYENCNMLKGDDQSILDALQYCDEEFLFPGTTIGEPAPKILGGQGLLYVLGIFGLALVVNHFLYNRPSQLKLRRSIE